MSEKKTYLDWAATAPKQEYTAHDLHFGNPSSSHSKGRKQRQLLNDSRLVLSQAFCCQPEEIIATSGATEANQIVMYSLLSKLRSDYRSTFLKGVVYSSVEHAAIDEPAQQLKKMGFPVKKLRVRTDGLIDLNHLMECLDDQTKVVAIIAVNNETGAIQPISQAVEIVNGYAKSQGRKIHFHTDAVQAFCKGLEISLTNGDSAAISAHKLGAPVGVGALWLNSQTKLQPLLLGGGQEKGRRSGTENVFGMTEFANQVRTLIPTTKQNLEHAKQLQEQLIFGATQLGLKVLPRDRLSHPQRYSPYITCLSAPNVPSEVLVRILSDYGIYVSRGSACSSNQTKTSPVLDAMGVPQEIAIGAFRVSLGWTTSDSDIEHLLEVLGRQLPLLRNISS